MWVFPPQDWFRPVAGLPFHVCDCIWYLSPVSLIQCVRLCVGGAGAGRIVSHDFTSLIDLGLTFKDLFTYYVGYLACLHRCLHHMHAWCDGP